MSLKLIKTNNKTLILSAQGERNNIGINAFDPKFLLAKNLVKNQNRGRGIVYFFNWPDSGSASAQNATPTCDTVFALRHYRRGGLVAKLIKDTFLFSTRQQTRAYKELEILQYLQEKSVNVPNPIAGLITKHGMFYTADLITEVIEHAQELHQLLQHTVLPIELWRKIGQQIRLMHNTNVCHDDINVKNVLVQEKNNQTTIYIIDFDKCEIKPSGDWKQKNLARFKRSLNKQASRYIDDAFSETHWQAFLKGYDDAE